MKMNEHEQIDRVRVICFIPIRTNQILQAHASLEGISKQDLLADILKQHAETLNIAQFSKEKGEPEKLVKKKKKKKKKVSKSASSEKETSLTME